MNLDHAHGFARWAAPKSWPDDIVVRVTTLLCEGKSVRRTARALELQLESVARVRRVLQMTGACARRMPILPFFSAS